jgi:hypothetical protein
LLERRTVDSFANALDRRDGDELHDRLAATPAVSARFSAERAADDWVAVMGTL